MPPKFQQFFFKLQTHDQSLQKPTFSLSCFIACLLCTRETRRKIDLTFFFILRQVPVSHNRVFIIVPKQLKGLGKKIFKNTFFYSYILK